jgi:DNA-binding ferritin-like protein
MASVLISDVLAMSVQSHLWHWQTKTYAAHEAFGEFYETLTETVDEIAEGFMGADIQFGNVKVAAEGDTFQMTAVIEELKRFKAAMADAETKLMSDENKLFHGVGDKVLEIVQATDKLLYLLTLK